jgi:glycosyltransferase involved in cell wall biosynthesis
VTAFGKEERLPRIAMLVWNEFVHDARVLKEAQTLQAAGHQVIVHALHTPGRTQPRETLPDGIEVVRVARGSLSGRPLQESPTVDPATQSQFRQLLRLINRLGTHAQLLWALLRARPAVIHAHDANVLPTAWLAARLARVPLIYDAHEISTSREGYRAIRNWIGWIERRLTPRVAGMITTTALRATYFARAYRIARPVVLQNRPRLQPLVRTTRIRDELGLTQPWPIVLYQGGLQPGRGLPLLIEAIQQVPGAYLVLIGSGRQAAELTALTQRLGLAGRVHFIPAVPLAELPSYTASADIGVQVLENTCFNHFTTDSNKLFEYIHAGLPVVASNFPEIRTIVNGFAVGLLVPPGDVRAISDALNQLIGLPDQRRMLAQRARTAAELLNWEAQEGLLLDLYADVLSGRN